MGECAVCGREARYLFAFPSGASVSVGVVYDGAPVCSPECAQELRKQRKAIEEGKEHSGPRIAGEEGE